MIRHYRGLESAYNPSVHADGIYFATDTHKIIHGGNTYGMDPASLRSDLDNVGENVEMVGCVLEDLIETDSAHQESIDTLSSEKAAILPFDGIYSYGDATEGCIYYHTMPRGFYKYVEGTWYPLKDYDILVNDLINRANPKNLYRYNGDVYYVNASYNLCKIADSATIETALAAKANESDVQDALTEIVNQLSEKADQSDVQDIVADILEQISGKADASTVATMGVVVDDLADAVSELTTAVSDNAASIEDLRKVDNVRIYCRRNDGVTYDYFVPLYDWNASKANTYVPEGVAIMTPGKVLVVALTESASTLPLKPSSISGNYKPTEGTNTNSTGTAISDLDGRGNTNALMTVSQFTGEGTMVNYCNTYATEHLPAGTWWVPSVGELMMIGAHFREINYALSLISGATQITTSLYVSSTMKDYSYWVYNLYQGMIAGVGPTASRNCRAVTTLQ